MTKFIELTDPDSKEKVLINANFVLSIQQSEHEGTLLKISHSGRVQELLCVENYEVVKIIIGVQS